MSSPPWNWPRVSDARWSDAARAANWGLNGYARQTTPELAKLDVVNYTDVSSCGSDTETSLPCLFSPVGRRDYDAQRIRASQSLLHVLARAGHEVEYVSADYTAGLTGLQQGDLHTFMCWDTTWDACQEAVTQMRAAFDLAVNATSDQIAARLGGEARLVRPLLKTMLRAGLEEFSRAMAEAVLAEVPAN